MVNLHSIRWRLPLSYAGIALLAALALGGLLLVTLRQHYDSLERQYLDASVDIVLRSAEELYRDREFLSDDVLQASTNIFSFLVRSRVRLLDADRALIADSGPVREQNSLSLDLRRPPATVTEQGEPPPPSYETFLSVQGEAPAAPPEMLRYPFQGRSGGVGRLLSTFGSPNGNTRADLSATVPIRDAGGAIHGYLEVSESPAFGREIIEDVAEKAIGAGALAVLLAAAAGWFASRQINQPVLALAETTRRMAEGDLSVRSGLKRRDEFGELARTFNSMAERVENTVIALKRFVADAAHEFNTPITALRTNLELAGAGGAPGDFQADIRRAQGELERLETLTHGLLTLSRLEVRDAPRQRAPIDLAALARQMHEHYTSRAEQGGIALALDAAAGPVSVRADAAQIARVFDNLLDNALKFTPDGGTVTLGVSRDADGARLWVADTGIGIPAGDLPRLFSRFHRGRNAAAYPGNGLGLVITRAIVEDHDGQIDVESGAQGTRFTVRLPLEVTEGR
jgi:signal transduction histidine kinase